MPEPLPIDARVDEIVRTVRERRAAVLVAPPGTGKTTRVPPALVPDGPVLLLEPRRLAARALCRRIAAERGWEVGREIGWQVRFERRFSPRTRLLVATEGVLTVRLRDDPLLEAFRTVVLDELHERSLHADLALALVRQAAEARGDLRVLVMSATLDAAPVAAFLGGCPVLDVAAPAWPVEISQRPGVALPAAVAEALDRASGHVLAFLPGAGEIAAAARELAGRVDAAVLPLHGGLDAAAQDAALAPSPRRKAILATNLAETSLTVDGVAAVVDSGWHKVMRIDPAIGLDRLETERVSADAAAQRAGRAGRTGPGIAWRLWDGREMLRPHREPEIRRVDLAGPCLDVLAWGGDPRGFEWFEAPPPEALDRAVDLLERMGAARGGAITERGRALARIPLPPRLAAVLLDGGASPLAAAACAVLSEAWTPGETVETTRSDLLALADRIDRAPGRVRRAAEVLARLARSVRRMPAPEPVVRKTSPISSPISEAGEEETALRRAVLHAWPDRVARRRGGRSRRLQLASGHGAVLDARSGVREDEWLVAVDLVAGPRGPGSEARVRIASAIAPEWLEPTGVEVEHALDPASGAVRAVERLRYGALAIRERAVEPDPERAEPLLVAELARRVAGDGAAAGVLRRAAFAGETIDVEAVLRSACSGRTTLPELDLVAWIPGPVRARIELAAPRSLPVPSGRRVALDYAADGAVAAAVKLQELFGLAATPRLGPRAVPVTFVLLAPNGRPVQTTRDLRSFWNRTYPEVRRELRGRYPKHPWPEDPWTAPPTRRTLRRPKS